MVPDPTVLFQKAELSDPPVGVFDIPDDVSLGDAERCEPKTHQCVFQFYEKWINGGYLVLTRESYGCGGCGRCFFGIETRSKEEFITFLAETEGLKDSRELMERWIDHSRLYEPENARIAIGPLREELYPYLKTVTFFVDPDRLSVLMTGAQYHAAPEDVVPVISPFGSGCMQLLALFEDLSAPQAIIGTTDMAMRKYIPPCTIAFTVTKPMYERLCTLDERSFLFKPFLAGLQSARKHI